MVAISLSLLTAPERKGRHLRTWRNPSRYTGGRDLTSRYNPQKAGAATFREKEAHERWPAPEEQTRRSDQDEEVTDQRADNADEFVIDERIGSTDNAQRPYMPGTNITFSG
jgi:hypothetical protein